MINNKIEIIINLNSRVLNYIISNIDYDDQYINNEIIIIRDKFNEIRQKINSYKGIFKVNFDNITKNIKDESLNKVFEILDNIQNNSYKLKSFIGNNTFNNSNHNISISKYLKEIKMKREIERLTSIINNNEYSINISKNIIPDININNINLFFEEMKYNITIEADKIFNYHIKSKTKDMKEKFGVEIYDEIDRIYKIENNSEQIIELIKELIPKINGNFSDEVEKDLNILYFKLFDLIGKSFKLNNLNENDINFDNENKTYYNKILNYLNVKDINMANNSELNSDDKEEENKIKDIVFISMKKIQEKKIKYFKSIINKFHEKYENPKNEINFESSISKIFEEKKKEELYSSYLNLYQEINNNTFILPELNKNKITSEDIKNLVLQLYDKNFNNFKNNYIYENTYYNNNSRVKKLVEEEIEKTLTKMKNIIETSLKEAQNINLDGHYLKKHLINNCESQINLYIDKNKTNIYIGNNMIQAEYIKKIEENYYKEKIYDLLIDKFRLSIGEYYSQYYNYEVIKRNNFIYNYYFILMFEHLMNFTNNKFDYLNLTSKNKTQFDNSTFQNIKNVPDKLVNVISKLVDENKFYSINSYIKIKDLFIDTFLNKIFNEEFMQKIYLTKELKRPFSYNDTLINLLENYIDRDVIQRSNNELYINYNNNIYNLNNSEKWNEQIINIKKNLINILSNSKISLTEKNFSNLYNLFQKLENQYNNIGINQNISYENGIIDSITKEFEINYKTNGIDKIIYEYDIFIKDFNQKFKNLTNLANNEINIDNKVESYEFILEVADEIINITKNYSKYFLDDIDNYFNKLKYFGMIDGLNYISIEKAEALKSIWDYSSSSNLRNLEKFKKKPKLMNFKKENEFYNKWKLEKKNKKNILSKMENLMNNKFLLRNLEDYNTRDLFNS